MQCEVFVPQINLEDLKRQLEKLPLTSKANIEELTLLEEIQNLFNETESLLTHFNAEIMQKIDWPNRMNFFPFNISFIQKLVLRLYNSIFRRQSQINNQISKLIYGMNTINRKIFTSIKKISDKQHHIHSEIVFIKNSLNRIQLHIKED